MLPGAGSPMCSFMLKRDIIVEQIERLVAALARIASHQKAQNLEEAERELDAATEAWIGVGAKALLLMSDEALSQLVGDDPARVAAMARLLTTVADVASAKGDVERAKRAEMKAFMVLDAHDQRGALDPGGQELLARLLARIDLRESR